MDRRQFIQSLLATTGAVVSPGALSTMWQQAQQHKVENNMQVLEVLQTALVPVPERFQQHNINLVPFISLMIEQSLLSDERIALERALYSFQKNIHGLTPQELHSEITKAMQNERFADMLVKIRDFGLIGLFSHPQVALELPSTMGYQPC